MILFQWHRCEYSGTCHSVHLYVVADVSETRHAYIYKVAEGLPPTTLKTKRASSSETSVTLSIYTAHIPEDLGSHNTNKFNSSDCKCCINPKTGRSTCILHWSATTQFIFLCPACSKQPIDHAGRHTAFWCRLPQKDKSYVWTYKGTFPLRVTHSSIFSTNFSALKL